MYNDFPIISETDFLKIKNAYNEKLNKIKSLNIEENFSEKFNKIKENLLFSLHYIENLIKFCKNIEDKNLLQEIQGEINNILENLKNLYEVGEIEENNNLNIKTETNVTNNLKNASFYLLCFLEELFVLIEYEHNIKIKLALNSNFLSAIEQLKKINSLIKSTNTLKVFSLFKRY